MSCQQKYSKNYKVPVRAQQYAGPKRPIEKILRVFVSDTTGASVATPLYTLTDSNINRTLVNTKLNGSIKFSADDLVAMALVRVPQGQTPQSLSNAAGALYPNEENVLWSTVMRGDNDDGFDINVDSKAMRKMRIGDTLQFLVKGNGANASISFSYLLVLKE